MINSLDLYELTFTITTKVLCRYQIENMLLFVPAADHAKIIVMMLDELPNTAKQNKVDVKTIAMYREVLLGLSKQKKPERTGVQ